MALALSAKATIETPVLIVGGGPVGLALSGDLGARGVPNVLIDDKDGTFYEPRANVLDVRSMELMRRWGLASEVRSAALSDEHDWRLYCTSLSDFTIARTARPVGAGRFSPERSIRCSQLRLDPILREFAASHTDTRLHLRWRLESLRQRGDCILAEIVDEAASARRRIAAQYVIDCTGADSSIRASLAIVLKGEGPIDNFAQFFVHVPGRLRHLDQDEAGETVFVDANGTWRTLERLDDAGYYRVLLRSEEHWRTLYEIDAAATLGEIAGRPVSHQLLSRARWQSRDANAERWREGNIILAGDAAHGSSAAGGLTLPLGLADAFDLAWKLEARLAGWGSSGLIDAYEAERRAVVARHIAASAIGEDEEERAPPLHPDIARDTAAGRLAREALARVIETEHARARGAEALSRAAVYAGSPIVVEDAGGGASQHRPGVLPGARAPHCQLPGGASTLELYGRGFVLLRLGPRAPEPGGLDRAFAHRGVPLSYRTIDDPVIAERHSCRLVLVRPDGHVAWRGDAPPADPLAVADRVRGTA
jgi:2-polyprenyl-6-methoxyphenol hydroxylase-like FAD-dependent oxidoreductase